MEVHNSVMWDWQYSMEYSSHLEWVWRIFHNILTVSHNTIMGLNNVMCLRILRTVNKISRVSGWSLVNRLVLENLLLLLLLLAFKSVKSPKFPNLGTRSWYRCIPLVNAHPLAENATLTLYVVTNYQLIWSIKLSDLEAAEFSKEKEGLGAGRRCIGKGGGHRVHANQSAKLWWCACACPQPSLHQPGLPLELSTSWNSYYCYNDVGLVLKFWTFG